MALTGSSTTVHYWTGSAWSAAVSNVIELKIKDSFLKPKYAEIVFSDPSNTIKDSGNYSAYTRVKIVDTASNKPIFFGRVEFIESKNTLNTGTKLILKCKDFLNELAEGSIKRDFSGPSKLSDLVKDIIDYFVYTEVSYDGITGGSFTVSGESAASSSLGNWVKAGTGSGRIIHVGSIDGTTGVLVLSDVINPEQFADNVAITEYSDADCTVATNVAAVCNGALEPNIDTTALGALDVGVIAANTAKNYVKSTSSPLKAITQLCLLGSSTGVYNFFLDEGSATSLFPPVFTLFARKARPSGGPDNNGLTIEYEGTNEFEDKDRAMLFDYNFPLPEKETYTEAIATTLDVNDEILYSTKKSGDIAYDLKIFKKKNLQAIEQYNQDGLDNSVTRFMGMTGTASIQRGVVNFIKYPYFSTDGGSNYTVVHTGDLVFIKNTNVDYASSGVNMVVTEINYKEPQSITTLELLDENKGIGPPVYVYGGEELGLYNPSKNSLGDLEVLSLIPDYIPPWSTILPSAIQGYQHDVTFAAVDNDTISITAGDITFYDKEIQHINYINSGTETNYNLLTDDIHYIYFDLGDDHPDRLKVTTNYLAAMAASSNPEKMGLMCVVKEATEAGQKATVIPSYGKEPLITADIIDMAGFKEWSDGDGSFRTIQSTQISSGYLSLTSDTAFNGEWYSESGVDIDASSGINIYGASNNFTTRATKAGTIQCYVGSDGKIYAGGGTVRMDSNGLELWNTAGTPVQVVDFASDGSGWIGVTGTKAMSWTTAGVVTIGGWSIDADYIWTGTKQTSDTYSLSGITLADTGGIRAKEFYIANDGSAYFKGTVTAGGGSTPIVLSSSGMSITNSTGGSSGTDHIGFFVNEEETMRGAIYSTDAIFGMLSHLTGDYATDIFLQGPNVIVSLAIGGALKPNSGSVWDLGSSSERWKNIYGTVILSNSYVSPAVNGMLLYVDGTANLLVYDSAVAGWRTNFA